MNLQLKRYKKDFEHSYTLGVFPTLELLTHQPQHTLQVLTHPKGQENAGIAKIREICHKNGIPLQIQEKAVERLSPKENVYAVGVFRKYQVDLDPAANHVVLVNPGGMGNLGTIMRTMLGFGMRDLAIIQPAADIFHPDTVRASMGALFQVRCEGFASFEEYRQSHSRRIYPLMTGGAIPLPEAAFKLPFALVFGSESRGLGDEYHALGTSIRIPQSEAIDSLNLAVAVGVTLYQARLHNLNNNV
ncbi:MAG: TrmH family RNA methyltransferase [Chloroflexota bacterium]